MISMGHRILIESDDTGQEGKMEGMTKEEISYEKREGGSALF